jgi:hypothetical protein
MHTALSFYDVLVADFALAVVRDWDSDPIDLGQDLAQSVPSTHFRIH